MLISMIAAISRYARYRSELANMSQLDDRMLRDIGISRADLANSAPRYTGRRPYP